jgi:uncharacterized delta-60 repeat protein
VGPGLSGPAYATALQPDGKVLVGGYFSRYNDLVRGGVVRFNADGTLDTSFAPTGTGFDYDVRAIVLQPDGKILVGGYFTKYNGTSVGRLARLNADGTLDASFALSGTGLNNYVFKIALQPDGKILVGGTFSNYNNTPRNALARLNADGTLDPSFALTGAGLGGFVQAIVVQPDGKLLVGGNLQSYDSEARGSLVRLNANGTLDASFASTDVVVSGTVTAMALQPDGKVVAGGSFISPNGTPLNIGRLNPDGTPDASFAPLGLGLSSSVRALAVQPDGQLVAGGAFTNYNGIARNYIARLTANGALDNVFAPTGVGPSGTVNDLALQPNGKVVFVGGFSNFGGVSHPRVVRVNANGILDDKATPAPGATYVWSPGGSTGTTAVPEPTGGSYQATATIDGYSFLSNTVTVSACVLPTVTSFTPPNGPVGTTVTLNGTGLTGTTSITFAGTSDNLVTTGFAVNAEGTQITGITVPSGAQTGILRVTTATGSATSAEVFTVTGAPNPAPAITALAPATAVAGSGAFSLVVNGTGFGAASVVEFNGLVLATTLVSATQLTAQVPASAVASAGSFAVAVRNPAPGGGTSAAAFTVTAPAPTIASFTPTAGGPGTVVTVTGTNLTGATAVELNGLTIDGFTAVNASTVTFTVLSGASSGLIAVTTPGGTATSTAAFTYLAPNPAPAITGLAPAMAVAGSAPFSLSVEGTGFEVGSVVQFNGATLATTLVSATQLTAQVPASAVASVGSFAVVVANPAPGGTSAVAAFVVTAPAPTIASFAPTAGGAGTEVTVTGTNFTGTTAVELNGQGIVGFTVVNASTVTFVVPAGASSGLIAVATPGGRATSTAAFSYLAPNPAPTITSLAPATVVAGSAPFSLVVNGTGFGAASVVEFNGLALATTLVSATQLRAQVPASAVASAGSFAVVVRNPAPGGGTSAAAFVVTAPAPTIASFTPTAGGAGTTVTITGTNFTGATAVELNGQGIVGFTIVNASTVTFVVPAGASSGLIAVTTPGGTATSTAAFTYLAPNPAPAIANLAPATAVAGSVPFSLSVEGTGFSAASVVEFNGLALATTLVSATQLRCATRPRAAAPRPPWPSW